MRVRSYVGWVKKGGGGPENVFNAVWTSTYMRAAE